MVFHFEFLQYIITYAEYIRGLRYKYGFQKSFGLAIWDLKLAPIIVRCSFPFPFLSPDRVADFQRSIFSEIRPSVRDPTYTHKSFHNLLQ